MAQTPVIYDWKDVIELKHKQKGRLMQIAQGQYQAHFEYKNGISLGYVDDKYLPEMLTKDVGCCGHSYKGFTVATEEQVRQWKGE